MKKFHDVHIKNEKRKKLSMVKDNNNKRTKLKKTLHQKNYQEKNHSTNEGQKI